MPLATILACLLLQAPPAPPPVTPAEASRYESTSTNAQVRAFCEVIAATRTGPVRATLLADTPPASPILVVSASGVTTPAQAATAGKPVALVYANIHAGEVDGKEAVLALARDLVTAPPGSEMRQLAESYTLVLLPNLNPAGNDAMSPTHRVDQNGPKSVGTRENAQKLDLNRDFIKLESPEIRGLVKLVNDWNPSLIIDCHTTNGSFHRYSLTYDGPRHPGAGADLLAHGERVLRRAATEFTARTGLHSFPYGDFTKGHTQWETYPALPRFGTQYFALTGRLAVLSESYTYDPFETRVRATRGYVESVLASYLAEPRPPAEKPTAPESPQRVAVHTKVGPRDRPEVIAGYVETTTDGKSVRTDVACDYTAVRRDVVTATSEAVMGAAYIVPCPSEKLRDTLTAHGIAFTVLTAPETVAAMEFEMSSATPAARFFQGHALVTVEGAWRGPADRAVPAGAIRVDTAQPLGNLAAHLLEPQAEDGLAAWNFLAGPTPEAAFAVLKTVRRPQAPPAPKPSEKKPFTFEAMQAARRQSAQGPPPEWLPDGASYLEPKDGKLFAVDARSGEKTLHTDPAKLVESCAKLDQVDAKLLAAASKAFGAQRPTADRSAIVLTLGNRLALALRDGSPGRWLTPAAEAAPEALSVGPGGHFAAFVRAGDLHAADLATGESKRLTTDAKPGPRGVLNGTADWVYEEEIFNRASRAYWFAPDGKSLAFLRFDDANVTPFPLARAEPAHGKLEEVAYPKAGEANPTVSLHLADLGTGAVRELKLPGYEPTSTIVSRVGWLPAAGDVPAKVYAYVQNREQTWLDFTTWRSDTAEPAKLFRDSTPAWIDDAGPVHALPGGDFLYPSERSGFKHVYRYAADGTLKGAVTSGEFEVRSVERVEGDSVIVAATAEAPNRVNYYRVNLATGERKLLTDGKLSHQLALAPKGSLAVDRASSIDAPPSSRLIDLSTGGAVRTLAEPKAPKLDGFALGKSERVKVPLRGIELDGVLTYPPDFDPAKKYPLWVLTYAGPHSPTVRDTYSPRLMPHAVAALGVVAFEIDPVSASGHGAKYSWLAYKQLGKTELEDLEASVQWVGKRGWLDPERVGISGHSYGGYITAYALTHGSVFKAGVAGAPVTDWSLYDSIYTERFMLTPKQNPEGYAASSVVKAAGKLHGRLLLCHGLIDDNVHLQNSAQLLEALQKAGKTDFEMMLYPSARHGIASPHYPRTHLEFIRRTMTGPGK